MIDRVTEKLTPIHQSIKKLNSEYITLWMDDMFLTWRWWLNVAILLVPWILWFIFRKKESTNRLMLAGLFVFFFTSVLDSVGVAFGLWYYTNTPLPYIHTFYLPWDFSMFPVSIMFLLQYKRDIHPIYKAIYFAVMSVFVEKPIFFS